MSLPDKLGPISNPMEIEESRMDIPKGKFESSQLSFKIALQIGMKSKPKNTDNLKYSDNKILNITNQNASFFFVEPINFQDD